MSDELNFGQIPNGQPCSCKAHYGCGPWTAHERAKAYAFQRDRLLPFLTPLQQAYLISYERHHGPVDSGFVPRARYREQWEKMMAAIPKPIPSQRGMSFDD